MSWESLSFDPRADLETELRYRYCDCDAPGQPWDRGGSRVLPFLGKRAAVLCPGPSLVEAWQSAPHEHDYVIAVNSAIQAAPSAQWWACYDRGAMTGLRRPSLGMLTKAKNLGCLPGIQAWLSHSILPPSCRTAAYQFTALGAQCLAAWLGAETIHVYGDDRKGEAYYDGTHRDGNTPLRWLKERILGDHVRDELVRHGVGIRRIRVRGGLQVVGG